MHRVRGTLLLHEVPLESIASEFVGRSLDDWTCWSGVWLSCQNVEWVRWLRAFYHRTLAELAAHDADPNVADSTVRLCFFVFY